MLNSKLFASRKWFKLNVNTHSWVCKWILIYLILYWKFLKYCKFLNFVLWFPKCIFIIPKFPKINLPCSVFFIRNQLSVRYIYILNWLFKCINLQYPPLPQNVTYKQQWSRIFCLLISINEWGFCTCWHIRKIYVQFSLQMIVPVLCSHKF